MNMQTPAWQDQRAHFHHALIYIDEEGKLHVEGSPSISNHYESIFSSRVIVAFLKAVAGSFGRDPPHLPRKLNGHEARTREAYG